jgi:YegS/Rv2252/BmrU family lipid kinase
MKPLLVVNPASGGGKTGRVLADLRRPIERALGTCEFELTQAPGHARELAREAAAQGRERIVAVGGDGTFSEVADGILSVANAGNRSAVGLIHQGTGGDFRRSAGLENRLDAFLAPIARHEPRLVDAGRITHLDRGGRPAVRHFMNVVSLGMGGLVDKYVGESTRLLGGSALYLASSLKALALGAVGRLSCEVTHADGRVETLRLTTRILTVCNGRYFGGGMQVAPMARLDDGLFDVVADDGGGRLPLVRMMAAIYGGTHLRLPGVRHLRVSSIAARLDNDSDGDRFLLDVDGELAGRAPVRLDVVAKALPLLA